MSTFGLVCTKEEEPSLKFDSLAIVVHKVCKNMEAFVNCNLQYTKKNSFY